MKGIIIERQRRHVMTASSNLHQLPRPTLITIRDKRRPSCFQMIRLEREVYQQQRLLYSGLAFIPMWQPRRARKTFRPLPSLPLPSSPCHTSFIPLPSASSVSPTSMAADLSGNLAPISGLQAKLASCKLRL